MELYLKAVCPKCKAINWSYWESLLDHDDTRMDAEGLECFSCGHKWLFDPSNWVDEKSTEIFNWNRIDWVDPDWEMINKLLETGVTPDGKTLEFFIKELAYIEKGRAMP
jgi:DNA-directed RNA polymerase subunit RPC12/RpoP